MTARRRNLLILGLVGVALALALLIVIPGSPLSKKTRLGLDLKGGIELIYQGKPTPQVPKVTPEAITRAIETIRKRTDAPGGSEPEIQRAGSDQISIGLPAVKNDAAAFYESCKDISDDYQGTSATRAARGHSSGQPAKGTACPATMKALADKGVGPPAGSLVIKVPRGIVVVKDESRGANNKSTLGYWTLEDDSELSGNDITDPKQTYDPQTNEPIVAFNFTDKGRAAFARATKREAERGSQILVPPGTDPQNTFQRFAITLDNQLVSLATINYRENPEGIPGDTGAQT